MCILLLLLLTVAVLTLALAFVAYLTVARLHSMVYSQTKRLYAADSLFTNIIRNGSLTMSSSFTVAQNFLRYSRALYVVLVSQTRSAIAECSRDALSHSKSR